MKEPFANLDTLIEQTKLLSDMELQSYLVSLGSDKTTFMSSNVDSTISSVNANKSAKFQDLLDQTTGADNNIVSSAYYLARTKDLNNITKDFDEITSKQLTDTEINGKIAGRQNEINEWENSNKLDTLYIMQILFISLSMAGIFAFLLTKGIISSALFGFLSYSIAAMSVVMIIIRWRYTNVARDTRYWHKARFPRQKGATYIAPVCPTAGEASFIG
jgi:hypothetical protein